MGGFGSMLHAASTMKANMALRKSKRTQKSKNYQKGTYKKHELNFPKVSEEELQKIMVAIRAKGKRQRTINYTLTGIFTAIVFLLIYRYWF